MGLKPTNLVIANGETKSTFIRADGRSLIRIDFPTMTSTAVTIQGCESGLDANAKTIGDESAAFSIISPSGRSVTLNLAFTYGFKFLRLVAGSAEGAERTIPVFVNDYLG